LLLFARNESTRFISPTKTPEYLAAGKPVISTSIRDVVRPYGELNLVRIADTPDEFINAAEELLGYTKSEPGAMATGSFQTPSKKEWLQKVDAFLANMSWDKTWQQMSNLISQTVDEKRELTHINSQITPITQNKREMSFKRAAVSFESVKSA